MAYDGSLKFDTSVDTSGFEDGIEKLADESEAYAGEVSERLLSAGERYAEEKLRIEKKRAQEEDDLAREEYKRRLANAKNSAEAEKIKQEELLRLQRQADDEYLADLKDAADKETAERDRQFKTLKYMLDMRYISEDEYYKSLACLRDTYFAEGSDGWMEYTVEIEKYNQKLCDNVVKAQEKMLAEQEKTAKKLADYGSLYNTKTITYKDAGEFGADLVFSETTLADLGKDTAALKEYAASLEALKAKRTVPDELFAELSDMDIDDAMLFVKTLLSASDTEFAAYIEGYKNKLAEAERIAKEISTLYGTNATYSGEISIPEGTQNTDEEAANTWIDDMTAKLEDFYGKIPEGFFTCGQTCAQQFKSGFLSQLEDVFAQISAAISEAMVSITPTLSAAGISTSSTSFSPTYNFYSSGQTVSEQLAAAKAAATVERLRGGY